MCIKKQIVYRQDIELAIIYLRTKVMKLECQRQSGRTLTNGQNIKPTTTQRLDILDDG